MVCAKFDKNVYLPKDAEFYFIYNGSQQRHVMIAERTEDNVLQSSIPGEVSSLLSIGKSVCEHLPTRDRGWEESQGEKVNGASQK